MSFWVPGSEGSLVLLPNCILARSVASAPLGYSRSEVLRLSWLKKGFFQNKEQQPWRDTSSSSRLQLEPWKCVHVCVCTLAHVPEGLIDTKPYIGILATAEECSKMWSWSRYNKNIAAPSVSETICVDQTSCHREPALLQRLQDAPVFELIMEPVCCVCVCIIILVCCSIKFSLSKYGLYCGCFWKGLVLFCDTTGSSKLHPSHSVKRR